MTGPGKIVGMVSLVLGLCVLGCSPPVEYKTASTLPADFPKDVPLYPKAELVTTVTGTGTIVVAKTTDPLTTVQEFLLKELRSRGWKTSIVDGLPAPWMGDDGLVVIAEGFGRHITVALGEKGKETVITTVIPPG